MIRGAGMPSQRHHIPGDMYIQFDVKFPERMDELNPKQLQSLSRILHQTNGRRLDYDMNGDLKMETDSDIYMDSEAEMEIPPGPMLPPGANTEIAHLEDVDQNGQRRTHGATMEDDEDDGLPQGGERVQCASQ